MGFCYGGGASLKYSLSNPKLKATGIFYGSLITDANLLKLLPGPVLGIFGSADVSIPVAEVNAFEAALAQAGIEHQISLYPDQGHAFVKSMEGIRAGGAQAQAWQEFLDFTAQQLEN
jgi:carboxymethylenebutenolidase